jgi:hypothetical protein
MLDREQLTRLVYTAACTSEEVAWSILLYATAGLTRKELAAVRVQEVDLAAMLPDAQAATAWLMERAKGVRLLGVSAGVLSCRISRAAARAGLSGRPGRPLLRPLTPMRNTGRYGSAGRYMPKMAPSLRVLAGGRQETSAEPISKRAAVELLDEDC